MRLSQTGRFCRLRRGGRPAIDFPGRSREESVSVPTGGGGGMQSRNIRLRFLFAVSLLSTLLAVPTTAQSTTRGSNADSVGGFHAVACTNTPAKRAAKLMAVCRNGYLPSNVITIAPNSKKLSGKTLSQLLALTWKTKGNAGTNSGTNFLGTTDKRPLELKVNKARALRLEPNATSPNVIGGFRGNVVTAGAVGAAIGGGGSPQAANR